jgi:putative heme-binding domain-containing protein
MRVVALAIAVSIWMPCRAVRAQAPPPPLTLEERLTREDPSALARAARVEGDPSRGALVFYQPRMGCANCHAGEGAGAMLGPDLAKDGRGLEGDHLVVAVLSPSKLIRKGFQTITVATADGRTISGMLAEEQADVLLIRDLAQNGRLVSIPRAEVQDRNDNGPSTMPAGLAGQLSARQDFLDLISYLIEITEKGPARALALKPSPALLAPVRLPEYESTIDHAGMIAGLDEASFKRGEKIYSRLCVNCHGTRDQPGSLPTSLRFATGRFKNGSDPYQMYKTLTYGSGQMVAQSWMVPEQKYDVIHYIRQAYLEPYNRSQYVAVDRAYLDSLPRGTTRGPAATVTEPWVTMDYGPSLMATVEVGDGAGNIAYKGISIRLDPGPGGISRGRRWVVYEHDTLRLAGAWTGSGFINWNGINFDGRHEIHPKTVGTVYVANPSGPGWADPETGRFDDRRTIGRDGKPYGPLPRSWARYLGTYHNGDQTILAYLVGDACVLETPGAEGIPSSSEVGGTIFTRTLEIGKSPRDLAMRVSPRGIAVALAGDQRARLVEEGGDTLLRVPSSSTPLLVKLLMGRGAQTWIDECARTTAAPSPLEPLTRGGPRRWPEVLETRAALGGDDGPFAVDVLTHPEQNPWLSQMHFTGFDFSADGRRAFICTWDGDVWHVAGLDDLEGKLAWRRIASGLFQPLGLKVVDGRVYVACRDQIAVLHDLNGDGEIDFYENFNSDHQVTEHFHEFAMDLQTDALGSFYYAKAARHAKTAIVPQHGTLLRVSKDGTRTEILARGFRAPNGVCLNPDGSFFLSDQEGHWTPKNRINQVAEGGFYGNMWAYHDVTDTSDAAMEQPLCWITNDVDRSPAELLWVASAAWRPLEGSLLSLSYGTGKIFVVPHETVEGQVQGGVCALPIPAFPTGVIRGRFHPVDGQLYLCGMVAWASNQPKPGGFYRVRYTGKPLYALTGLRARTRGMELTFSAPLDRDTAGDPARYAVTTWSLKRTENYGSKHLGEALATVRSATLSDDRRTVLLDIANLKPTQGMEILYSLRGAGGEKVEGRLHNTIHRLSD